MGKRASLILVTLMLITASSRGQLINYKMNDSGFLSAVDWYIDENKNLVNARTGRKVEYLKDAAIISLTIYNLVDSIAIATQKDQGSITEMVSPHSRCNVLMTLEFHESILEAPPSGYFYRSGVFVAVYTGMERYIDVDRGELQKLVNAIRPKKLVQIDTFKKYMVQIDEKHVRGFRPVEIK